jgi:succinate dehydrogenase / fumarate reductase iron-sulfur subunit
MTLQQAPTAPEPTPTVPAARTVRLRVFRFKQGDERPHFDEFTVPFGPRTTVLDCLVSIRNTQDPTLILRHSCFHASCGTCGMRVNDREVLACVTKIADLGGGVVKVEPIANQNLLADLVTDMVDFYDRFAVTARPLVRASESLPGSEVPAGVDHYERFENCIECGLCVSACPIVASDARYLGPAALAGGWRVVEEPRDRDATGVLQLTDDPQGSWRCHLTWECSAACPSNVDPAEKIMLLRRAQATSRIRTLFGRGGR